MVDTAGAQEIDFLGHIDCPMTSFTFKRTRGLAYRLFYTINASAEENNSIKILFPGVSWKGKLIVFKLEAEKYVHFQPDDFDAIVPIMTMLGEDLHQFPDM